MSNVEFAYPDLLWTPENLAARLNDPTVKIVDVRPRLYGAKAAWLREGA